MYLKHLSIAGNFIVKHISCAALFMLLNVHMSAQSIQHENLKDPVRNENSVFNSPPNVSSLRTMAEWEEIQALTITWADFPSILKQIVKAAIEETEVYIITDDPAGTLDYLTSNNSGGQAISNTSNITLIDGNYNTIWMRDYGANSVYINDVDSLIMVDWKYNRPRPADDVIPDLIAEELNLDLYKTTTPPYDLLNTGGKLHE